MINKILIDGREINEIISSKNFKLGYEIECNECKKLINRKWYDSRILSEKYYCKSCNLKLNNPMFNDVVKEKHLNIVTSNDYKENMSVKTSGDKNGFYGKTHKKDTIEKIKKGFNNWFNNLTDDDYQLWVKNMSLGNNKLMNEHPEFYKSIKSKAAKVSHKKQFSNCKMNKIEKKVDDFLKSLNVKYKYSVILGENQYDFGIKDKKILIEVDGDYWHGNPKYYNLDGSNGKRKLNNIQLNKIEQDKNKNKFASEHHFKIIRLWESEINNNNFKDILKNEIN